MSGGPITGVDAGDRTADDGPGFEVTRSGLTLFLSGELDLSSRDRLARATADLIVECVPARVLGTADGDSAGIPSTAASVVIDAAGLQFIDAAGLGVLVALHNSLARGGVRLGTVHPSPQLRRLSAMCHLDGVLGVEPLGLTSADPSDSGEPGTDRAGPSAAASRAQPHLPPECESARTAGRTR